MQKTNGSLIFEFPSGRGVNNPSFKMLAAAWNMISGGEQYLANVSELANMIEFQTKERLIFLSSRGYQSKYHRLQ